MQQQLSHLQRDRRTPDEPRGSTRGRIVLLQGEKLNWKFANQTPTCKRTGAQQAHVDECSVKRLGSNYLRVPLVSARLLFDERRFEITVSAVRKPRREGVCVLPHQCKGYRRARGSQVMRAAALVPTNRPAHHRDPN